MLASTTAEPRPERALNLNDDIFSLINKIFCVDAPLSKEQHLELQRPPNAHIPEVILWLAVLESVYEDWCIYVENPIHHNKKLVRDIFQWGFKANSFNLDMISDAVYIAYRIEPDVFREKFKAWLIRTKPRPQPKHSTFVLTEPFESFTIDTELFLTPLELTAVNQRGIIRRIEMLIEENITKPIRNNGTFPFKDIPMGGGLLVSLSEGEDLEKIAMKVRNALASFKKTNRDLHFSTFVLEEQKQVLVYRDATESETEGE